MNGPFRRRGGNRDTTLDAWFATAANAFGPEYEMLISRAICLTGNLSHIKWVWLASQAVPDGVDLMEAASRVRVIPRFVIVPRAMRDRMVKQIEDCGWRAAYNVFDGDDLMTIHGYDWRHPKLPGSPITYPGSLVHDVCLFKGWRSRGDSSQHRRRTTLTLVRLNKIVIQLGIWADGPETPLLRSTGRPAFGLAPSPKNDMIDFDHAALGNAWGIVGDHHDDARPQYRDERCQVAAYAVPGPGVESGDDAEGSLQVAAVRPVHRVPAIRDRAERHAGHRSRSGTGGAGLLPLNT